MLRTLTLVAMTLLCAGLAHAQTPSPADARVYFVDLAHGATVKSPLTVRFGLSGMGVAPAGVAHDNTGHHHLLVDRAPFGEGEHGANELRFPIMTDAHHIHFGAGQTETTLDLPPGPHTLQLVLGDWTHIPHDPPVVSELITVIVE